MATGTATTTLNSVMEVCMVVVMEAGHTKLNHLPLLTPRPRLTPRTNGMATMATGTATTTLNSVMEVCMVAVMEAGHTKLNRLPRPRLMPRTNGTHMATSTATTTHNFAMVA